MTAEQAIAFVLFHEIAISAAEWNTCRKTTRIGRLIVQATPGDFPESWQMRAKARSIPQGRQVVPR